MSKQSKKKSPAKLVGLALLIYLLLFGGIYLYMSGNLGKVLSVFQANEQQSSEESSEKPSDKPSKKPSTSKADETVQYPIEEQIHMDDGKSDEVLDAEVDYLIQLFFEDEEQTVMNFEADEHLLGWIDLKRYQIEDDELRREVERKALDLQVLYGTVDIYHRYLNEPRMVEYLDDKRFESYEKDLEFLAERNEAYANIAKAELKKLKEVYEEHTK